MLCLNCGKEIPIVGTVCPWCRANKQQSTLANAMMYIYMLVGGGIGAFIGHHVDGEAGLFAGAIIGGFVCGIIGFFRGAKPVTQNVDCPYCSTTLTVNRMEGPNFTCFKCRQSFHIQ